MDTAPQAVPLMPQGPEQHPDWQVFPPEQSAFDSQPLPQRDSANGVDWQQPASQTRPSLIAVQSLSELQEGCTPHAPLFNKSSAPVVFPVESVQHAPMQVDPLLQSASP